MKTSVKRLSKFAFSRSGATAIEYALMAGSIALVIITTVYQLGDRILALYTAVEAAF